MIAATSSISHVNKFIFVCSENLNPVYSIIGTSLTSSAYLGWLLRPNIGGENAYAISRGEDGRIGMAYGNDGMSIESMRGNVYFFESTDDGNSFSSPVTVWQTNFLTDSIGCLRSHDICYTHNTPNIVFSVLKLGVEAGGSYYPESKARLMFWSPGINGGNPVTIDTCSLMQGENLQADLFYGVCRPVIGRSSDNSMLYTAWCRSRSETGANGNNYFDIYFSYSTNGGSSWFPKIKITNTSGPLRDCRYVSMSQSNSVVGGVNYVHLLYQMDSIPGSFPGGTEKSFARMMYAKLTVDTLVNIQDPGTELPGTFSLEQNYPNPFNPSTTIRFELPKNEHVTLKVYDARGRLINVLIDEFLTAGPKEIEWNPNDMAGGVYFYTIAAGEFRQSKKMILLK